MRASDSGSDWLDWCQKNRAWLAAEFLRVVDQGQSVRPFFGSWYDVRGHKQTGYFLGHEVVKHLAQAMALRAIALLECGPTLEKTIRGVVTELAANRA